MMSDQNYTASFTVDQTPEQVFDAINNVRGWWSQAIEGDTDKLNAVFYYHYKNAHRCTIEVTEFAPGKRVVWHVLHNDFDFIEDKSEWQNTDVVFAIAKQGAKTELPLYTRRPRACLSVLQRLLKRVGLLHNPQPARPHHQGQRQCQAPAKRFCAS